MGMNTGDLEGTGYPEIHVSGSVRLLCGEQIGKWGEGQGGKLQTVAAETERIWTRRGHKSKRHRGVEFNGISSQGLRDRRKRSSWVADGDLSVVAWEMEL